MHWAQRICACMHARNIGSIPPRGCWPWPARAPRPCKGLEGAAPLLRVALSAKCASSAALSADLGGRHMLISTSCVSGRAHQVEVAGPYHSTEALSGGACVQRCSAAGWAGWPQPGGHRQPAGTHANPLRNRALRTHHLGGRRTLRMAGSVALPVVVVAMAGLSGRVSARYAASNNSWYPCGAA